MLTIHMNWHFKDGDPVHQEVLQQGDWIPRGTVWSLSPLGHKVESHNSAVAYCIKMNGFMKAAMIADKRLVIVRFEKV